MPADIYTRVQGFLLQSWGTLFWMVVLFIFGRYALKRLIRHFTSFRAEAGVLSPERMEKREKRSKTLRQVLVAAGNTVIYAIIFVMLLNMFGVNTTPFITGAGVIGLAIGFGSQALVKDFMSGILVLYEGQYSVGDRVKIAGFEGTVKKITIRSTVLEGKDGERIYVSNGGVSNVVNFSQQGKPKESRS